MEHLGFIVIVFVVAYSNFYEFATVVDSYLSDFNQHKIPVGNSLLDTVMIFYENE